MKNRYRLFSLVLYSDSESYDFNEVMKCIKGYKYYSYILHNADVDSNGNKKKEHYHVIIKLDNASTISALSKKIGLPENYIQNIRQERSYVRYLIHFDDPDKYQYLFEDIKCSRSYERFVSKCFDDLESEQEIIHNIYSFIVASKDRFTSYADTLYYLIEYVNSNCYDTIFRRYRYEFKETLQKIWW